jgi:hypothetical protein
MPEILTSIHGKKLGFDVDGNLIIAGGGIFVNNDSAPVRVAGGDAAVAAGATKTLTVAEHSGKEILLDTAAGSVVTLPAATGSRAKFRFRVSVLATSNSHIIKVANANDTMQGIIQGHRADSGNAVLGFAAGATDDTITLNRTTTGSVSLGEWIEVEDVAANLWHVKGELSATGAAFATPFSATVS